MPSIDASRHVLIVKAGLPPHFTGGTPRLHRWLRVLPEFGWRISLAGFVGKGYWSGNEPIPTGVDISTVDVGTGNATLTERLKIHRDRLLRRKPFPAHSVYFIPRLVKTVVESVNRLQPDIVMVTVPDPTLLDKRLLSAIQEVAPGRLVVDARDPFINLSEYYGRPATPREATRATAFLRVAAAMVDGLDTVTNEIYEEWEAAGYKGRWKLVPNSFLRDGSDHHEDWPGRAKGVFQLCYTGTLTGASKLAPLVPAVQYAASQQPDILDALRIKFAGREASPGLLGDWSGELSKCLVKLGSIEYSQAKRLMRESDVLVTIRVDNEKREWPGGKLYEYMGARRPLLVGAYGSQAKLTEQCQIGLVGDPMNPSSLGERLLQMYSLWKSNTPFPFGPVELTDKYETRTTAATLTALFEEVIESRQ